MKHKYLKNVAMLDVSAQKCIGCGMCTEVCPHDVLCIVDNKVQIKEKDSCMECGACAMNCPVDAISVDASVGCAAAIIKGWLTGSEPSCDCSDGGSCC
jgi:NAD-dependent dihydropyrimidine dehydrogenase PreA subunit